MRYSVRQLLYVSSCNFAAMTWLRDDGSSLRNVRLLFLGTLG